MNRIAVAEFQGAHGDAIASSLSDRLWKDEFYTVVDRSELGTDVQTASYSPTDSLSTMLSTANQAGVDGVIVGSVIEYRCEDQILESSELQVFEDEIREDSLSRSTGLEIEKNQTLLREGTVTLAVRLIDTETGEIRASKQVSQYFQAETVNGIGSLPTKGEVLNNLSQECLDEVVQMLAPHEASFKMQLAKCDYWTRGRKLVKAGLRQASDGNWTAAEESWQQAVELNPENHAAYYNLAVAAVRREEYNLAEAHTLQALKIEHKDCYTTGLDQIRQKRTAHYQAEEQHDARVVTAAESLWR